MRYARRQGCSTSTALAEAVLEGPTRPAVQVTNGKELRQAVAMLDWYLRKAQFIHQWVSSGPSPSKLRGKTGARDWKEQCIDEIGPPPAAA